MSEKTYLQAATLSDLLDKVAAYQWQFATSGYPSLFAQDAVTFTGQEIRAEILRRFAALEAERDGLLEVNARASALIARSRNRLDWIDCNNPLVSDLKAFIETTTEASHDDE